MLVRENGPLIIPGPGVGWCGEAQKTSISLMSAPTLVGPEGEAPGPGTWWLDHRGTHHLVDRNSKQRLFPSVCILRLPVTEEVRAFQDSVHSRPVLPLPSLLHRYSRFPGGITPPNSLFPALHQESAPFCPPSCLAMPLLPPGPWFFSSNSQVTQLSASFSVLPSTPRGPHLHPEGAACSRLRHAERLSHQAATHAAIQGQPGRVLLWARGSAESGWRMRRGSSKGPSSYHPTAPLLTVQRAPPTQTHHGWRE